ncbi:MAG TPA: hypothetical protein VHL52_07530 [Acidimicrobiia bacterium]|nr:hypothetical protein [Acidimicrobiia bacterium]
MTTVESRLPHVGNIPVVLPSLRDPRLHTAGVIISIHTIGITALGFKVSVPQILSAIVVAALIDIVLTLRATGQLVWPASGMLTGSGVALILRLVEMSPGEYWTWNGWYIYALVAGVSVLSKHAVRWRGSHLFNPSNVGLVGAFLIFGSDLIEPLDFWWAPLDGWMAFAYVVILVGGVLITRRLALLEMAVAFWVVLATGLGILASTGHCMIAAWSAEPVCDTAFWWTVVTSPEVLIFQLFMITDPKTIPGGRRARVIFASALGVLATLLIAPQTTEYGAKVGLLASLVMLSPVRNLFDRFGPETVARRPETPRRTFLRGVAIGWAMAIVSFAIALAGLPARQPAEAIPTAPVIEVSVDQATLPDVSVGPGVAALNLDIEAGDVALTLAENLLVEAQAVKEGNGGLLAGVATGQRLAEMQRLVDDGISTGERRVSQYSFDSLRLDMVESGEGQSSAALSMRVIGTETKIVYDAFGTEVARQEVPARATFVLRKVGGERWLVANVIP